MNVENHLTSTPIRPRKSVCVLVVDDEALNLGVAKRGLVKGGYHVDVAANAGEALQIINDQPPFDLYVLDVMMPGMRGTELADTIRSRQPDAKILFITAYSDQLFHGSRVLRDTEAFVDKPFTRESLLEAVSLLLFGHTRGPHASS